MIEGSEPTTHIEDNNITSEEIFGAGPWVGIQLIDSSDIIIEKNNISNYSRGILIDSSDGININYNNITYNEMGIQCYEISVTPYVHFNNIHDNTDYGVYNKLGNPEMAAQSNWWGHPSGPYNPPEYTGSGDEISDNVNADNWLESPYIDC